jgi:hypothetical protein
MIEKRLIHAFANETSVNVLLAAKPGEWNGPEFLAKKLVGSTVTEWI